ncbi:MAG: inositol monophosphatase [Mesoaciditoga sp.]|uniref:inositol monophosphatase family protein n=1 Tax=Athalassotoga sp. TaxID=2022597 RepID=UPI000CB4DA62|nr:MAG: inositol monophosphatase [Mesoaciditoga sp.]PMP80275.1 MAG: inositol monophosphatase [Mesoaciditoga sp.]HEU23617.1 inositol monophosphatase [Mesoaciditoga lauensis]
MDKETLLKLNFAKGLAREAGLIAKKKIGNLGWTHLKSGFYDVVTDADVAVEKMVKYEIEKSFEDESVLGEETGEDKNGKNGKIWIIDPIDGTTNFSKGIPHFCVSISYVVDNDPLIGVVYDPYMDELYEAVKGNGAFMNGEKIMVNQTSELTDAILNTGYQYSATEYRNTVLRNYNAFFGKVRAIRVFGSAVLDQCYVANGRIDGFWEYCLKPWDVAAGSLIAKEAGASVRGIEEEFSIYGKTIVVANSNLISKILEVIKS